jgi:predicted MFS family arabinose efflux permease
MVNAAGTELGGVSPSGKIWTKNLIQLAAANFMLSFGMALLTAVSVNFFVQTLKLNNAHVLWLTGIREIPGLCMVFVAALMMHLPLSWRAAAAVLLMGIGYALYALVNSYLALVVVALIASLGFHIWMPLGSALALGLTTKENSGKVLGTLGAVNAAATIVGMGAVVLLSNFLPLRSFNGIGGLLIVVAAVLLARLPKSIGETKKAQPRLLFRRHYWLYYVLTFFEGSRTQVFGTFGILILVQAYHLQTWQTSLLLLASSSVNLVMAPIIGRLLDRVGERLTMAVSYVLLALSFVGYATVHNPWFLSGMVISINMLVMSSMGLNTYVHRIAPPEELTPTLSTGVSVNHITSVTMSLLAGTLLQVVGYEALCWGAAGIIMLSVPFALALRTKVQHMPQLGEVALAE